VLGISSEAEVSVSGSPGTRRGRFRDGQGLRGGVGTVQGIKGEIDGRA
jgi:hypothetical protein